MTVSPSTLTYALNILSAQLHHKRTFETTNDSRLDTQGAYYRGMHDMLEILVSEGYTGPRHLHLDEEGHFTVHKGPKGT